MDNELQITLVLEGTTSVNGQKEVAFKRETKLSLRVTADNVRDPLNEAIVEAVKADLSNVLQEAVDDGARGYRSR